jgi:peptidoglycan hydrolase-like protein with peptidoglycan-binding domain
MTAAILTRLPLEAGGAVLAVTGRAVHSAFAWGFAHYMRAPLASTGIAAMLTLSLMATSNALYFQHARHPAPLFVTGSIPDRTVAPVLPAPRPTTTKKAVVPKIVVPKVEATSTTTPIGNSEVFELQRKLETMKLFTGTVDGYYGPQTAGAIRAFEKKMGLKSTGQLTPEIVKAVLNAPLAAVPEPKQLRAPEPLPATNPLPKVMTEPVKVVAPVAQPEPEPKPQTVTAKIEIQPVADSRPLVRELPETPQEAMNIAVETAGDAIDTIINGVQTLSMTTPSKKPAPKAIVETAVAVPAPLQFGTATATPTPVPTAIVPERQPMPEPLVTASVASAPQAAAVTEVRVAPQEVPVLDTEAKVEDLMPPFSVTDPVIVSRVQRGLASLGFLHGPIDGVAGEATAKAIRTFETFYNYERTGRITPELPDLLVKAGATL